MAATKKQKAARYSSLALTGASFRVRVTQTPIKIVIRGSHEGIARAIVGLIEELVMKYSVYPSPTTDPVHKPTNKSHFDAFKISTQKLNGLFADDLA